MRPRGPVLFLFRSLFCSLIAAVEVELLSSSLITLEKTCKRDGVKLFPLDRSILEFWRPANQWPFCISGKNVSMQVVSMQIPKKPCGSWVLQVYWGPGYAHLRGNVNNGLNVVNADRRVGKYR